MLKEQAATSNQRLGLQLKINEGAEELERRGKEEKKRAFDEGVALASSLFKKGRRR